MNLKDYFKYSKDFKLSENDKLDLYEKIISKKDKRSIYHSFFSKFSMRYLAYWFITAILLIWIYWVYFIDWDDWNWFIINSNMNQASASYIAKVVDFNWEFYIKHDWKLFKTSNISDGDNIILKKDSEIVFNIDSGTKAKIIWPAALTINQINSGYQIEMSDWEYIQMESLNDTWSTNLEIVMWNEFSISSEKNINLVITKTNNEYKISNQGDNIKITKNNKTKEIKTQELAAIDKNDITLIQNMEDFKVAFTDQKINQTFEIKEDKEQDYTQKLLQELSTWAQTTTTIINTWAAEQLWITDEKLIPTTDQIKQLYTVLDQDSINRYLENMIWYWSLWNEKDYIYYKSLLNKEIQKIYTTFNIKNWNQDIISNIKDLISELDTKYHIPNTQIDNLKTLIDKISNIENQPFWWKLEDITNEQENVQWNEDLSTSKNQ